MLLKLNTGITSISLDGAEFTPDKNGVVDIPDSLWDRRDKSAIFPVEEVPKEKKDGKK